MSLISPVILLLCFKQALFTDIPCVIELECEECVPDNMPLVTSHGAVNGSVRAAAGEALTLTCGRGAFLAYPARAELLATCEAGRYRVQHDLALRHLLDLGCQESIFEDVLHQVDDCAPPLQGRAYQMHADGTRHLATLCFDQDRGVGVRLRMTNAPRNVLPLAAHAHRDAPLSILGNFNHMFDAKTRHDAEKLYSDDARLNRRLHELFKHDKYSFADQTLTSVGLLSGHYFEDQNMRAAEFVSNRVAVWRSVAKGNLRHMQHDIAKLLKQSHTEVDVYTGTHGTLTLRAGRTHAEVYLRGGKRFPVPKYIWSVVHAKALNKALAVVVLNDPFVRVGEARAAAPCESRCTRAAWLHELRRRARHEAPLYGLAFCCSLHNFTAVVPEMTTNINVPTGNQGMLTDLLS